MFDSFRGLRQYARLHGDLYFAALLDEQRISLRSLWSGKVVWQGWLYRLLSRRGCSCRNA